MSQGQGSFQTNQRTIIPPPPGPPFVPTSADNGLSVDPVSGRIVLGNDLGGVAAKLLSNREIPFDFFFLFLTSAVAGNQILIQPATPQISISTSAGVGGNAVHDGTSFQAFSASEVALQSGFNDALCMLSTSGANFGRVSFRKGVNSPRFDIRASINDLFIGDQLDRPFFHILKQNNNYSGTRLDIDDTTTIITAFVTAGFKITGDTVLIHTGTALANGAGALLGTLANSPVAGNPTKWIAIDDNGVTRHIPAW